MSSKMHFEIKLIRTFINPLISTFINPYNKDHFKPAGYLLFHSFNFDGLIESEFSLIPGAIKSSLVDGPGGKK